MRFATHGRTGEVSQGGDIEGVYKDSKRPDSRTEKSQDEKKRREALLDRHSNSENKRVFHCQRVK